MDQKALEELVIQKINERGVTLEQIAQLTYFLQSNYYEGLTLDVCLHNVKAVLKKREVQNAVLTGIRLDELAEMNLLGEPLQEMVDHDYSLYGIDGSIGFTNYGYIDKLKPGILGEIDKKGKAEGCCQTFMDDLVGAIAAAAASRIAHRRQV